MPEAAVKGSLIYGPSLDLKNTIIYCPEALQTSKNKMKKINLLLVEKYLVQGGGVSDTLHSLNKVKA